MPLNNPYDGKTRGISLPNHLKDLLVDSFFPNEKTRDEAPVKVPETISQQFARDLHDTLRSYLEQYPTDYEMLHWLETRLPKDKIYSFIHEYDPKELISAKTIKRAYDDEKHVTGSTVNILQAFYLVRQKQQATEQKTRTGLSRCTGLYLICGTHHSSPGTYQISMMRIEENGKTSIKYNSTFHKTGERYFKTKFIGTTGLLLTHESDNYILIFYLYIGEADKPPFLQGVHLYSNRDDNAVANLSVFQRIETSDESEQERLWKEFVPKRELTKLPSPKQENDVEPEAKHKHIDQIILELLNKDVAENQTITVRENIQRFISNRVKPLSTIIYRSRPFNFAKRPCFYPASNHQEAEYYNIQREFVGEYHLYFNEHFPSVKRTLSKGNSRRDFFSSVGKADFEIFINPITGQLSCKMIMQKNINSSSLLIYEGMVINDTLTDPSTLIVALYLKPAHHRYLHMIFNIVDENRLMGCFNITYSTPMKLGAGIVAAIRKRKPTKEQEDAKSAEEQEDSKSDKEQENPQRAVIASEYHTTSKTEKRLLNLISRNLHAIVVPPDFYQLKDYDDIPYWGVYRLYYMADGNRKNRDRFRIHTLIIYPNGRVELRVPHVEDKEGEVGYGECELRNDMLNLTLRDTKFPKRSGFFCIRVEGRAPSEMPDRTTTYSGSFAGYSFVDRVPIASLCVLEYVPLKGFSGEIGEKEWTKQWSELLKKLKEKNKTQTHVPEEVKSYFKSNLTSLRYSQIITKPEDLS